MQAAIGEGRRRKGMGRRGRRKRNIDKCAFSPTSPWSGFLELSFSILHNSHQQKRPCESRHVFCFWNHTDLRQGRCRNFDQVCHAVFTYAHYGVHLLSSSLVFIERRVGFSRSGSERLLTHCLAPTGRVDHSLGWPLLTAYWLPLVPLMLCSHITGWFSHEADVLNSCSFKIHSPSFSQLFTGCFQTVTGFFLDRCYNFSPRPRMEYWIAFA